MNYSFDEVKKAIYFLHVKELKYLAKFLQIIPEKNKLEIINQILNFVKSGEIKNPCNKFPSVSMAKKNVFYQIAPEELILKGAYKNDLKTRLFFKDLIGQYFHFTAFGIDWINDRWKLGNPPTYKEFAHYWNEEFLKRKKLPAPPKKEWMLINFVQNFIKNNPKATKNVINEAWKTERLKNLNIIKNYFHWI